LSYDRYSDMDNLVLTNLVPVVFPKNNFSQVTNSNEPYKQII